MRKDWKKGNLILPLNYTLYHKESTNISISIQRKHDIPNTSRNQNQNKNITGIMNVSLKVMLK